MRVWYMVLTASGEAVGFTEELSDAWEARTELDASAPGNAPHTVILVKEQK